MPWNFWAGYLVKLAVVALVLGVLYLIARRLRQARFSASAGRFMNVIESRMLSQCAAVHLLRVGTRYFLIGSGSAGISKLAEVGSKDVGTRA